MQMDLRYLQTSGPLIFLYLLPYSHQFKHQLRFRVISHPVVKKDISSAIAILTGNSRAGFLQNPNPYRMNIPKQRLHLTLAWTSNCRQYYCRYILPSKEGRTSPLLLHRPPSSSASCCSFSFGSVIAQ